MAEITPHLWFDTEAEEAARFYTSVFEDSEIVDVTTIHDTPSGDCPIVSFTLAGQPFQAISAGPLFKFNPSISFLVSCESADEVDALWSQLSKGGQDLMELGSYPFSDRYGWTNDRFGLSWQVMLSPGTKQKITPSLLFVGDVCGKTAEAVEFYTSVFDDSSVDHILRRETDEGPEKAGTVQHAGFKIAGYEIAAMDSAREHNFAFNEAISFMVSCDSQEEIDRHWDALTAVPESEQCGWLKDRFGLSWQIVPGALDKILQNADEDTLARVVQTFLKMKKLDLAKIEAAAE